MTKFPCRNCLTLAICKARYNAVYKNEHVILSTASDAGNDLIVIQAKFRCDILENYLWIEDGWMVDKQKVFHKFFLDGV